MTEAHENPAARNRWSGANLAVWVIALLVLHPLSLGPVIFIIERGWVGLGTPAYRFLEAFYWPEERIMAKMETSSSLPQSIYRYLEWWQQMGNRRSAPASPPP